MNALQDSKIFPQVVFHFASSIHSILFFSFLFDLPNLLELSNDQSLHGLPNSVVYWVISIHSVPLSYSTCRSVSISFALELIFQFHFYRQTFSNFMRIQKEENSYSRKHFQTYHKHPIFWCSYLEQYYFQSRVALRTISVLVVKNQQNSFALMYMATEGKLN